MYEVLEALYFFLPAYVANMAPVLAQDVALFDAAIDGGKSWRGERIFGAHKTYRGFFFGVIGAVLTVSVQRFLMERDFFSAISLVPYDIFPLTSLLSLGFVMGVGALVGDLVKSFLKRRLGIASGGSWTGFDQLDFVVGALVLSRLIFPLPMMHVFLIVILTPLLHLAVNGAAHVLGLKKVWW